MRALGLGQAFTAVADDLSAAFWNPAGLPQLRYKEFVFVHDEQLYNFNYNYIGYVNPIGKKFTLGTELHYFYVNDIRSYDYLGNAGKKLSAYDSMFSLAGGYTLYNSDTRFFGLGTTGKLIQQKLADERAVSYSGDLGSLYLCNDKRFGLGFTMRNLPLSRPNFSTESAPLPTEYRLGTSYKFPFKTIQILISTDLILPRKEITYNTWGLESVWWNLFALRAGYRFAKDTGSGISFGAGTTIGGFKIDYAFVPFGELGESNKISIGFAFGKARKDVIYIGNEERAAIHYERAIIFKQEGDDIAAAYEFSSALRFYQNYRDAQLLLESEIKYFYSRGMEAYEDEDYTEAVKWFELALKYNADHADAKQFLKRAHDMLDEQP
ncbi:MAG: PorV/PorQ family protein [bacterium]